MLVLERLSDAERNGHEVLALIKGSAVNQDGASNGLTAPNGPSQERVIRQALANARLEPKDVDVVEGHGTGTTLGDPIEAGALLATYGQDREEPLRLGSIKSNIGHTQAAAGVAGTIKMVEAMRRRVLPKTLHVDAPSSKVEWASGQIELLTEQLPWEPNGAPRRAGVSSFGVSGTNAHVILEEAPDLEPLPGESGEVEGGEAPAAQPLGTLIPLALSAKTEPALAEMAERLAAQLKDNPGLDPTDVAFSLTTTRSTFEHRAVALGADREELLTSLGALADGKESQSIARGRARTEQRPIFIFPGQGSQWEGMALDLIAASPVFAAKLAECEQALVPHVGWSVTDVLRQSEGAPSLDRVEVVQPALFAVIASLAALWRACGVHPAAVVGHSQGEIVAAHVAGGLSLEDAAMLVALRSRIISKLSGRMASVALGPEELEPLLEPWGQRIEVAAHNGPSSTILSGEQEAIEAMLAHCEREEIRAREISPSIASHSAHVEEVREEVLDTLAPLSPQSGEIPFHSTVTGGLLDTAELDASYWYRNLRETVRFEEVTRNLIERGGPPFIEVSPHPVFALAVGETIEAALGEGAEASVIGTLRREEDGPRRFALSLAEAHAQGIEVEWGAFFKGTSPKRVALPTYPFQRERYWLASSQGTADASAIGQNATGHPLLSAAIEDPDGEGLTLTGRISLATHPWLADHAVGEDVLLPGAAFVELALRGAEEVGAESIEELILHAPLLLAEEEPVAVQVKVSSSEEQGKREIQIHSRPEKEDGQWTRHATGLLSDQALPAPEPLGVWPPTGAEPLETEYFYDVLAEAGIEYGPAFQGLLAAWRDGEEVYVETSLPEGRDDEAPAFVLHPALLDAALQGVVLAGLTGAQASQGPAMPFSWSGVSLHAEGPKELRARISTRTDGEVSIELTDTSGAPLASVRSLALRRVDPTRAQAQRAAQGTGLLALDWQSVELGEPTEEPETETLQIKATGEGADAAREATEQALEAIQAHLADPDSTTRLTFVTEGAMAVKDEESPDPTAAPLWGLVRSATTEHPGRFALIDTDGSKASDAVLDAALALGEVEPQLALREGAALVARLASIEKGDAEEEGEERPGLDPERTILITGATGGLGSLLAKHLAEHHGAHHLLLVSRSGPEAEGAKELAEDLRALGAEAEITACDVSDRKALAELLARVPAEHPLGGIFHCAGTHVDGRVESLDSESLEKVFAPKADAAWHLHELSRDSDLGAFVLYSSAGGTLGGPGQGNYDAANVFLDALAQKRRAEGLAAISIAWGVWGLDSGMITELTESDLARMRRGGVKPFSGSQGLALLDAALAADPPTALAAPLDRGALRTLASAGVLPPLFSGLVRAPRRRGPSGSLGAKLATLSEPEHEGHVLELVRAEVAAVLGHTSARDVDPAKAFQELGFDSLAAVELRNRLNVATGLRLTATVVFDYPNAAALATHLLAEASASGPARALAVRATASEEPIAIVGMACRYPGTVASPQELWRLVSEGADGITELPRDRGWDTERLYDPDPDNPGTSYAREGGFLAEAADFDAEFFAIAPREALAMDPQQRLLLESSWEALESAGIDPASLRGEPAGVFAGLTDQHYAVALGTTREVKGYQATGATSSVASGRVAYALGLEGPAISIDTACSSSLVAMHLASQALRGGECNLALAGGVTTLATPGIFVEFSAQRGLAPDGRCKPYAEAADGTGLSEGVGILVLERLSDARRAGHEVLALIKGSAVNQDGASNGLTAPNGPSQERVIRQALANARLEPKDVDVVEGHGTGTTLGDPIEAGALLATYGQDREEPLRLGSIKSNIGHTQAAAGVAGTIKMVEAMRRRVLPKTLHVDAPSSKVEWASGQIELLTEQLPWEPNGAPRRAGVSSFGISGTNAHVILEEAPGPVPLGAQADAGGDPGASFKQPLQAPVPLALSAKTEPALQEAASRLITQLKDNPGLDPTDVAFSLTTTRSSFEHRAVAFGESSEELFASLGALADGEPSPNVISARAREGKLAYLLTGQGAQRLGMGKELYESDPDFRQSFDSVCKELDRHLDTPLQEVLFAKGKKAKARLDDTTYAQPALFGIEVALHEALAKRGLKPELLAGHSVGEIAAAHISGVLDLPDAARLITARGALMGALPKGGAMAAIEATELELTESIEGKEQELSIAAINAPTSTVISGKEAAVEEICSLWQDKGKKTKRLAVSHAFHSPLIEPMLEEFTELCETLDFKAPQTAIVSNLTGETLTEEQATDPAYWVRQAREPVRFKDTAETLAAQGAATFIELGPDPVLSALAQEALGEEAGATFVPTLREGRAEQGAIQTAVAHAHAAGARPDWQAFFKGTSAKRVPLPTYPFQRKRYWLTSGQGATDASAIGLTATGHPLLGAAIEDPDGEGLTLTGRISLATHPWLADHAVGGTAIFPGTGFLEAALAVGERVGAEALAELILQTPLSLLEEGATLIQVSVSGLNEGNREIQIYSRPEEEEAQWTLHASGVLSEAPISMPEPLGEWPPTGAEPLELDYLYDVLAEMGLRYGPAFQGLTAAWKAGDEIYVEASLPEEQANEARSFAVHPALLDSALHAIALAGGGDAVGAMLPFSWSGVGLHAEGPSELRARISARGEGEVSIEIADAAGTPVASVGSLALRALEPGALQSAGQKKKDLLEVQWTEASLPEEGKEESDTETLQIKATGEGADAAREATEQALAAIQAHLADSDSTTRLTFITTGAMAVKGEESPDPATAALWGLVRSAASEHPGRFALIDTDGSKASDAVFDAALALGAEEPQLALREGIALVARLASIEKGDAEEERPGLDPERTILITGATGSLGSLLAKHLAEHHGAHHLLLVSRSGPEAEGAKELAEDLRALGAEAEIAACDAADREALQELLAQVPAEHPLGAIFHCAGTLADATVESLDPESLEKVFAPKADAAWHLHELSRDSDLGAFVLYSSAAGTLGGPGQGNYAAANVFCDALAQKRRAEGLAASSIAWGFWQQSGGMTSTLTESDLARMRRSGVKPFSGSQGLALFDAALAADPPTALAAPLDRGTLRTLASAGVLPPLFSGLVRAPRRRGPSGSLGAKLATLPEPEHEGHVLALVRAEVAAVLGHTSAKDVDPAKAFQELGFDSLAAVELRNRLNVATGLRLTATAVFDYPNAAALAEHLLAEASAGTETAQTQQEGEVSKLLAKLETTLSALEPTDETRARAGTRLYSLLANLTDAGSPDAEDPDEDLTSISDEEMFELIDEEFGGMEVSDGG